MITDAIIVGGLVLFSLAYCISCTHWANQMSRKARAMQKWVEDQRGVEDAAPYGQGGQR